MALQDFSSDARLGQAVLLSPSPNFCQRLHRWRSVGQNWRPHCLWGAADGPGIQSSRPGRAQQQSALGSAVQAGKLQKASAFGLAGTGWPQFILKNQATLSCSLAFQHLLHSSAPVSGTPVAIVCFLPTPTSLFTLSEERGDGTSFFPSSSPVKKIS